MIENWLETLLSPSLDWIQVEVTSHCNANCIYCPNTVYRDSWNAKHLPLTTFERLRPAFSDTNLVHLQGWGEPLLNPDFFRMASIAKQAGCMVGLTTNGMLLDNEKIVNLVELGIDIIAFSLAGIDGRNDAVRKGTSIEAVFEAIKNLKRAKEERGSAKPAIHIAYMLLRSGLDVVERMPDTFYGMGIGQVVVSMLDFVPTSEIEDEAIIPAAEEEFNELAGRMDAVTDKAKRCGLDMHFYLRTPKTRRPICTENPARALFVSSDGAVSPCVFTNVPVSNGTLMFQGVERPLEKLTFGNVNERSLSRIWRRKEYARFRNSFYEGNLAAPCRRCHKLYIR